MHQLVVKRFQHCLMHGVTMKFTKIRLNICRITSLTATPRTITAVTFSRQEIINTIEKSACQKLPLLKSPTSLFVARAPVDHRTPTVPNKISYQLQSETNFRIGTLKHADRPYTTSPPTRQHTEKRSGVETKGTGGE